MFCDKEPHCNFSPVSLGLRSRSGLFLLPNLRFIPSIRAYTSTSAAQAATTFSHFASISIASEHSPQSLIKMGGGNVCFGCLAIFPTGRPFTDRLSREPRLSRSANEMRRRRVESRTLTLRKRQHQWNNAFT